MSLFAGVRSAVGSVADRAVDLALPATCAGCYVRGTSLCRECRVALQARLATGSAVPLGLAADPPGPLAQLEWCAPFTGLTRRVVERLRDAGERRLSRPLGEAIASRWAIAGSGGDVLVPVPSPADETRSRGYDHTLLLAEVAARRLRVPAAQALARTSANDFAVIAPTLVEGRSVVLVHDVVTSTPALAACAGVLIAAGAHLVSAVAVARAYETASVPAVSVPAGALAAS